MQRQRPRRLSRQQIWQIALISGSLFACGMICSLSLLYLARQSYSDAELFVNQGIDQFSSGNYEEAITSFDTAAEKDPAIADIYYFRGQTYAALDNHEQAIADYTRALELDTSLIDTLYVRGVSYEALGNTKAAVTDYNAYLDAGGEEPDATARLLRLSEAGDE